MNKELKELQDLVFKLYTYYEEVGRPHSGMCECSQCESYDAIGNVDKKIHDNLWELIKPR